MKPSWHTYHIGPTPLFFDTQSRKERINTINTDKPKHERETRLRLFQPVTGELPKELIEAWELYEKTQEVADKARETCSLNSASNLNGKCVCEKEAELAYQSHHTLETIELIHRPAILALHAKECPNCPWTPENGTIFPN